ncbi:hypothetical protein AWL63_10480 [Sphingomonas panacis]|uniref:Sarcosine oxidase subunit gamma n=1 Tax=Sphingomonas panacis TaxID=1560345 RepID=A0A1B3ZA76_9SPHN|nr:sarcosine oxidase subunit gamma family protein [Sphingomonas panacis]AOH84334.1 hypothetical protein AWL63_10480 [Sphingomonas panacis]
MADVRAAWTLQRPSLSITESAVSLSILRVMRDDVDAATELEAAFGFAWPTRPNSLVKIGLRVAWLAPGEWAIFAPADQIFGQVTQACSGRLHHLGDLSAGRRAWRISGPAARVLIAKGCSLDTHPRVMSETQCAQTLLTQVSVLMLAEPATSTFDIVADASFVGHLRDWFTQVSQECIA